MSTEKKVDETWKENASKEKDNLENEIHAIEASFAHFISSLAMQALILLGQIPNPVTKKEEKNIPQARFIIDTINMLKEKTKGNLTKQEEELLTHILYDLRVKYVELSNKPIA